MSRAVRVPRVARRILLWTLPHELRRSTEGDLEEVYCRRRATGGQLRARFAYWWDTLALAARFCLYRLRRGARRGAPAPRRGGGRPSLLDVRLGLRMLLKYPGLSLIGGIGIAVTIAICTGFWAAAMGFLYPSLPIDEGERLVGLENWDTIVNNEARNAIHDFHEWRAQMESVEQVSAFRDVARNLISDEGEIEPVWLAEMTASGFEAARVPPLLGRYLVVDDERREAPPVVVLGRDVWLTRFGADPDIVGRPLRFGDTEHTVVGVMPEGFGFPMHHSLWVPLRADPTDWQRGEGPYIYIFGRLASGFTREQAQSELTAIGDRAAAAWPETHGHLRPQVLPYTHPLTDIQGMTIWDFAAMQLMVSLLVLVVAFNVAVLAWARTATRRGEIAIRMALGASRARVVLQLFVEAFVLSCIAALAGLGLAAVGLQLAERIMEFEVISTPFWSMFRIDGTTMLYALALAALVALIVGVLPGLQATGRGMRTTLAQLGGGTGLRLGTTWTTLIVAQVAMTVFGLTAGVVVGWEGIEDAMTRPAFAADEFVAVRPSFDEAPPAGVDPAAHRARIVRRQGEIVTELMRRLEREPDIIDVTLASDLPGHEYRKRVEIDGPALVARSAAGHTARSGQVGVDFFTVVEATLRTGRTFEPDEMRADAAAVMVNRAFVDQLLEGDRPLGRRLRYRSDEPRRDEAVATGPWHEIVGVIDDLYANAADPDAIEPTIYHPLATDTSRAPLVVARFRGKLENTIGRTRELGAAIDPDVLLGIRNLATYNRQQEIAGQLIALSLGLVMTSVLLLAAGGIYALMSFAVTRQRREIGIRTALGAHRSALLATIFRRSAVQLGLGLVLGIGLALAADVWSADIGPIALPAMAILVLIVGAIATWGPARRGLRIDPTEALRAE